MGLKLVDVLLFSFFFALVQNIDGLVFAQSTSDKSLSPVHHFSILFTEEHGLKSHIKLPEGSGVTKLKGELVGVLHFVILLITERTLQF